MKAAVLVLLFVTYNEGTRTEQIKFDSMDKCLAAAKEASRVFFFGGNFGRTTEVRAFCLQK